MHTKPFLKIFIMARRFHFSLRSIQFNFDQSSCYIINRGLFTGNGANGADPFDVVRAPAVLRIAAPDLMCADNRGLPSSGSLYIIIRFVFACVFFSSSRLLVFFFLSWCPTLYSVFLVLEF